MEDNLIKNIDGNKHVLMDAQGNFYDPWDSYKPLDYFDSAKGKRYWNHKRVNEKVASLYEAFIKTRNASHKRAAERAYRDG